MTKVKVFNRKGEEVRELELSDAVFSLKRNDDLIHQAYVCANNNRRQVLAHTKTRGERAGSGIKPWRQKGTGRARVGSVRTPIWRKGGVVFGPRKDRNFKKNINKKMKSRAIAMVLGRKMQDGEIKIIDKLETENKKTKEMVEIFSNLKISGKVLLAFGSKEKDQRRAIANLPKASSIMTYQLNVFDMLNNKFLLISEKSVKELEDKYKKILG